MLRPLFNKLDNNKMDTVLLGPAEGRMVDNILDLMKYMEGIPLDLQRDDITVCCVRDNCLEVIEIFSSMHDRLKPDAQILNNSVF